MGKHEILLVDDDPEVLKSFGRALRHEGYNVTEESSGEGAVRALSGKDFDLVITDLNMYQTDGLAVLKKARERYPETLVLLSTGDTLLTSSLALSLGFDDYMTKPCKLDELLRRVGSCFEKLESNMEERTG